MNEIEFENIIKNTKKIVLSAIGRYLNQNLYHAIDDVAQETYLRIYKSMIKNQFMAKSKFETWVFTIAKNEALRMNQKCIKDKKIETSISEYNENTSNILKSKNTDEIQIKNLKDNIVKLPPKYKSVFDSYIKDPNEKSIANELALSTGTVKSRLHRGKKILLKLFKND